MAFALLKNVLGTGTNIKRGNLNGKLGKALAKIEGNAAAGGFNFSYRDTGLAGAIITCEAGIAGHVSKKQTIYNTILTFTYVCHEEKQSKLQHKIVVLFRTIRS